MFRAGNGGYEGLVATSSPGSNSAVALKDPFSASLRFRPKVCVKLFARTCSHEASDERRV
jgi:hypothetical protein